MSNEHEKKMQALLEQFIESSNKRLESYAAELRRLNENMVAWHSAMERQAEEIVNSRDAIVGHDRDLKEDRELIEKLVKRVFGDPSGSSEVQKLPVN
jgi:Mg2+ and Co2+ transporter CorA